jgi:hypothetical protein
MPSRMSDQKRAEMKAAADNAKTLKELAQKANGHGPNGKGVTRVAKEKADAELKRAKGKRGAARLKEEALVNAGAEPKLLRRIFG